MNVATFLYSSIAVFVPFVSVAVTKALPQEVLAGWSFQSTEDHQLERSFGTRNCLTSCTNSSATKLEPKFFHDLT